MSGRKRTERGEFTETVSPSNVLDVFETVTGPVVMASDVATALDCSTETARRKLQSLYEEGVVDRRKTGRTVVWWTTSAARGEINDDDAFWDAPAASGEGPSGVSEDVDAHLAAIDADKRPSDDE